MSLLSKLFSRLGGAKVGTDSGASSVSGWRELLTPLGVTEPQCPYCGQAFDKMPQRKRACPGCDQPIYSRKRAFDGTKALLTEQEARENEGQDVLLGMLQATGSDQINPTTTIEALRAELGRAPKAEDLVERHLLTTAKKHATDCQWGLYRNARFNLAESRIRRDRREDALRLYLEVCLVDLNGPRNCGTNDPAITERFPPFDPTAAFLAPGVVSRAATVAHDLGLSPGDLRLQFDAVADSVRSLNLPRPTADAWNELASALSSRST